MGCGTGNYKVIDVPLYRRLHDLPASVMTVAIRNASFAAYPVRLVMDGSGPAGVVGLRILPIVLSQGFWIHGF
jgi:hypothetical protein